MCRILALPLLIAFVACASSGVQAPAAEPSNVKLWSGAAEPAMLRPLACGESSPVSHFSVPEGGGNAWSRRDPHPASQYRADLTVEVTRGRPVDGGWVTLVEMIGGEIATSVKVEPTLSQNRWTWRWGTIDLVHGPRAGAVDAAGTTVRTSNFLTFNTVHPGRNPVQFQLRCAPGAAPVARFEVQRDANVYETDQDPAHLRLTADGGDASPTVGKVESIKFSVENTGDLPANRVRVSLRLLSGKARVIGRQSIQSRRVRTSLRGQFLLVPLRQGPIRVEVRAGSANSNQPAAKVAGVAALTIGGKSATPWTLIAAATAVISVSLLVALSLRRRQSGRHEVQRGSKRGAI